MEAPRIVVQVDGETFTLRRINQRDYLAIMGRLGILPTKKGKVSEAEASALIRASYEANQAAVHDAMLCACAVSPKIVAESPLFPVAGVVGVNDIPDAAYHKLIIELINGSGLGVNATSALDPSSETAADSSSSTPSGADTGSDRLSSSAA